MIKNRKFLAVILTIFLVITSAMPVAVMAGTSLNNPDATLCGSLGMLIGEGNGLTEEYLAKVPTRIQAAMLYLRLKGLENEAKNYIGASNFDDVKKAPWAENVMAYLKAHPELGMVGMGDNKFSPDTNINAQGYYKILLEALGYKAGVDFAWENTISFANSKGLFKAANETNFTLNSLATATVEALKTTVKESAETLAGTLSRAGIFNSAQLDALAASNISLTALGFDVAVKSSSTINIKFNAKVTDTSKVTAVVLKDNTAVDSLNSLWTSDGLELNLTKTTKYEKGSYTVQVMYDSKVLGSKSLDISQEKVATISFIPKIVLKTSDIKGEVSYKAYNQYGEDISTSPLINNIIWASSAESVTVDLKNTKLILTKNGTPGVNQLKDLKVISIAGYDNSTSLTVSEQLDISDGFGLVKDIKFLGISNPDGKTDITVDSKDRFFIGYEAYDEQGRKIDTYSLMSNPGNFGLYTSNPAINAHVVRDPDNTSRALIEIDTHTASGTAEISGVVLSTGKKAVINVEVKKGAVLTSFVIEAPAAGIPINERVEIPYKALDQNGNLIKDFDLINGKLLFIVVDGGTSTIVGERNQAGEYVLTGRFDQIKKYTVKVVIIETNVSVDYAVETKAASVPTTIAAISRDIISDGIVENGEIKADFVKNPAFKILDQNGIEISLGDKYVFGDKNYYINAKSQDQQKVAVYINKTMAYKSNEIILIGGTVRGTTTITFELCSDSDLIPSNGKEVLDVKDVTISNIDRKDILSYSFAKLPVIYADPELTANDKYISISTQKQQYAADIKVYGSMSGGKTVALDPVIGAGRNILTMTVTDPKKFDVDLLNRKLLAKPYGNEIIVTDKLTATIQGANGVITTISTDVSSSKDVPIAQSIDAAVKPGSSIKLTKDSLTCTLAMFNGSIAGKELRSYNATGNETIKSDVYFVIKDQYGITGLTPSYFAITKTQGNGTVLINPTTGLISGTAYSGDQYMVTAVTNNGLTKTITINIQ